MSPKRGRRVEGGSSEHVPHGRKDFLLRIGVRFTTSLVAIGAVIGSLSLALPAQAVDYPTWEDVQRAQQNEAATAAEVTRVEGLLQSLNANASATQEAANIAAGEYQSAVEKSTLAEMDANRLAADLEQATAKAEESTAQVGALVARMGRAGSSSISLELLADPDSADDALYKIGAVTKLTERSSQILDEAKQAANLVSSLNDQADVAAGILKAAQNEAEGALNRATETANAAQAAADEQSANQDRLIEQLAVLTNESQATAAGYAERLRVEAEARRKAAEEAARQAEIARQAELERQRQEAANRPAPGTGGGGGGGSTGGGGGGGGGVVAPPQTGSGSGTYFGPSSAGWWRPASGGITSPYGPRKVMCPNGCSVPFHAGLDFAGASGSAIKAVTGGTVTSVGNAGGFGNRVIVDHGGGVQSHYGHLSGFAVRVGQRVEGGQTLGYMGMTGVATGVHLDLKIYVNGSHTDPAAFLRARGVRI